MMRTILIYVTCLVVFLALDSVWIGYLSGSLYSILDGLMADPIRITAAVAFYLLQIAGILVFVLPHGRRNGSPFVALGFGALFGICTYGTYDLTNEAVLRVWTWRVTLTDMAWGAIVTGIASSAGIWMERLLGPE